MENMKEVKKFAVNIRKETIKCIGNLGVGHIGGSLSIADVLDLTVEEAMAEGMGACPDCDPPVYIGPLYSH